MNLIRRYAIAIAFALTGLIIAALLYPELPARVPVHWSAAGVVDHWMPKSEGAFIQPITTLAVIGLLIAVERREWRGQDTGAMHWLYPAIVAAVAGFMFYVTILMLFAGMGSHLNIPTDITVGIGILFAALGNNLGKVPPNRIVGIRLPRTLSNREVWSRTHRVAGWLFTLGGLTTVVFALTTRSPAGAMFGLIVLTASALVASAYSFMLSRRLPRDGTSGD